MAKKSKTLRIGIDCRTMLNPESGERAGVGHYTFHIVKALLSIDRKNTYVLYFDHRMPAAVTQAFEGSRVIVRRLPFTRYGKFLPFAYAHVFIASWLNRDRLDVFHAPANVMPLVYTRPTVVTIHDLAIYTHPEWFPSQLASTKLLVPKSVQQAAAVIAVSEATRRDIIRQFKTPKKKISVVYEAADTEVLPLRDRNVNVRKTYSLPKSYVLYVGTIEPRKSLASLVQAWVRLQQTAPKVVADAALVIAGGLGYRGQELLALLKKVNLPSIHYLGYLSHNHKIRLMAEAEAFVFPTRYEGFGLPVLEAMRLQTPVITTSTSSIPEITGSAALLFEPDNVQELTRHLRTILTRPATAAKLRKAGRRQAKQFSWTKAARETLAVYQRVAAQR